jgi:hypothetical protein
LLGGSAVLGQTIAPVNQGLERYQKNTFRTILLKNKNSPKKLDSILHRKFGPCPTPLHFSTLRGLNAVSAAISLFFRKIL